MTRPAQWDIQTFDTLDSTQSTLKAMAEKGAAEGLVIQAYAQTAGKGRAGNSWISPKGNLYMSLLLKPDCNVQSAGQLAFVMAVAVEDALSSICGVRFDLKWPNDVLYQGQKVCGILLETEGSDWLIAGMGVNVEAAPEGAMHLKRLGDLPLDIVRNAILQSIQYYYTAWLADGFESIREKWLERAYGLGQPLTARLHNVSKQGMFAGIDADGALLLQTDKGMERIASATVHFGEEHVNRD